MKMVILSIMCILLDYVLDQKNFSPSFVSCSIDQNEINIHICSKKIIFTHQHAGLQSRRGTVHLASLIIGNG